MKSYYKSPSLKKSEKSEHSLIKKGRKPNAKGKDTRFFLYDETYQRIKSLEKQYNIKQSAVVKMAIDYLFDRYQSMNTKDFLIAVNNEYLNYVIANSGASNAKVKAIMASLEKVLQNRVKKL